MKINLNLRQIRSYTELMKFIKKLITVSWGADNVTFISAYPKLSESNELTTPIITYRVKDKVPGEFKSATEIKPRIREYIIPSENNIPITGENLEVWGQMFDYYIDFEIWAENGEQADDVASRFQSFMFQYTGYLKQAGVNEILFERMTSDVNTGQWRTDLINRTITYRIRIDEIVAIKIPNIESVGIDAYVHDSTFHMELELYVREHPELIQEEDIIE